jgi:hypothetical protein
MSAPATPTGTPRSSPSSATARPPGRCQRGASSSPGQRRPDRLLLPEQPVGHLRAQREADPLPLYQRARGFGFPGVRVDGNDVLATYAVTKAALDRARSGQGPTLIEAYTYRMGAHTTSDDPTKYRSRRGRDVEAPGPDRALQALAGHEGIADAEFFARSTPRPTSSPPDARGASEMPDPEVDDMFDHVYVEDPPRGRGRARRVRRLPGVLRGRRRHDGRSSKMTIAKGSTPACAPRWRRPQGRAHG